MNDRKISKESTEMFHNVEEESTRMATDVPVTHNDNGSVSNLNHRNVNGTVNLKSLNNPKNQTNDRNQIENHDNDKNSTNFRIKGNENGRERFPTSQSASSSRRNSIQKNSSSSSSSSSTSSSTSNINQLINGQSEGQNFNKGNELAFNSNSDTGDSADNNNNNHDNNGDDGNGDDDRLQMPTNDKLYYVNEVRNMAQYDSRNFFFFFFFFSFLFDSTFFILFRFLRNFLAFQNCISV